MTFLLGGAASGPVAAQDPAIEPEAHGPLLYLSQAECLRAKADMYLDAVGIGPSLVFVGFCEDSVVKPSPGQISSASTLNSLQDSVIRFTEKQMRDLPGLGHLPVNMKAVVVVLSREQITCIRDRFDDVVDAKEGTKFTRKGASGDVEDKVAELRLNECE
ncbi:hypothetical protein [Aliiroseovarius sp. S2029]|uniref:hypothetical protein n=1 Tax=Aliiroseovarius sp. S2029 TaxID=2936988 RepID=UPI0020BD6371|nr:hypothetical protein [Aliiroseovarius sp. S2029]